MSIDLTFLLLPTEALVVDGAPGWPRVKFTPQQVNNAVEAGANLFKNKQTVKADMGYGKGFINSVSYRNGSIKLGSSIADT